MTGIHPKLLLLALLVVPCTPLWGQESAEIDQTTGKQALEATDSNPPDPQFEDEIVVTATDNDRLAHELPYSIEALRADEVRRQSVARTMPEALAAVAGTMVQKTAHGQGSIFLRGFTGYRTLLLVDGFRLNNSVFREGPNQYWATVDPLSLARIEVVRGPMSVLYGSESIGGTVQAFSLEPPEEAADGTIHGFVIARAASAENSLGGRIVARGAVGDRFRFLVGAGQTSHGDLEAGGTVGIQPKTGYDSKSMEFKGIWRLGAGSDLVLGYQRMRLDDAWRTHKTVYAVPWRGTTVGSEQKRVLDQDRDLVFLTLTTHPRSAFADQIRIGLSYQRQMESRDRRRSDNRSDLQGFDIGSTGGFLRSVKKTDCGEWTWGFDLYHDSVDSFSRLWHSDGTFDREMIQGPVGDDATYDLLGVYLQREHRVSQRGTIWFGARYTHAETLARKVLDPVTGGQIAVGGNWDGLVGALKFGLRLDAADNWRLFGGVSQGFRAPNLSDLTRLDSARSDEIETPSPYLDEERFVTTEVGLKARRTGWSLNLSLFHTTIDDMIIRYPTGREIDGEREVTKDNIGDGWVHGIEITGELDLGRCVNVFVGASWLEGEVDTFPTSEQILVREPIDRMMPPSARLAVRWQRPGHSLWLEATLMVADRQDRLSTRDMNDTQRIPPGGTPGFSVVTIRGGAEITKGLHLVAALENITDTEYRTHGSGLNNPGRNLVMALELDF